MMTFGALLKNKLSQFCGKIYQILFCGRIFTSLISPSTETLALHISIALSLLHSDPINGIVLLSHLQFFILSLLI